MPTALKEAAVIPILKKPNLPTTPKNYRPVSTLPLISKLIEDAVLEQLNEYFCSNNLDDDLQSAYRKFHSTETAPIKIVNDILVDIDNHKCVFLALLDLSAAFDTCDISVFLRRLRIGHGISGTALDWITSYLTDRSQRVTIDGDFSNPIDLECGFP